MKRFLTFVFSAVLLSAVAAESFAQSRFGVIGGVNFSTSKLKELNRSTMTQYHAGFTCKLDLPLGFSLQPSLIYNVKGARMQGVLTGNDRFDISMGYLELPVSLQWGPDLLIFRPFLDVTPYIGYALNNRLVNSSAPEALSLDSQKNVWDAGLKRLEYGLGLGAGIEIWRFQLIGRYNWNFGPVHNGGGKSDAQFSEMVEKAFDKSNFGGFSLSLAFLFGGGYRR